MVFQVIISNTNIVKVFIIEKSQFKAWKYEISEIMLDIIRKNKMKRYFKNRKSLNLISII